MSRIDRRLAATAVLIFGLGACEHGPAVPAASPPPHRPSDGLLSDPALQEIVALKIRRDGPALVERLSDPRAAVRARAAYALGSVQTPDAIPALLDHLVDPDAAVRRDVAFALGQTGVSKVGARLLERFPEETDREVRLRLIEAISKLTSPESARALARLEVRPEEEPVRALAVARMGAVDGVLAPEGLAYLLGHLEDDDARVRFNAAYYFGRAAQPAAWGDHAAAVRGALDRYAPDEPAAMHLVLGLGKLGDPADNARLEAWARRATDWRVKVNAMTALGARGVSDAALAALFSALDDPSIHVATAAATTLGHFLMPPSSIARVKTWVLSHPDRMSAVRPLLVLLARLDEREFVFDWVDALASDNDEGWAAALEALSWMAGEEAARRMERGLEAPSNRVRSAALRGFVRRWRNDRGNARKRAYYFQVFSRALEGRDAGSVAIAAPALADSLFRGFGNVALLESAYSAMTPPEDTEAMAALLGALGATGDRRVEPLLRHALNSPLAAIRREAARALGDLTGEQAEVPVVVSGAEGSGVPAPERLGFDPSHIDWSYLARLGSAPRLTLETTRGTMVVRLATEDAPQTVQTIARLVEAGKYDGTPFHRVVPNFVIQGGDFSRGDGFGTPGFAITSELTLIPFRRGVIGMASAGKDTEGSQFFLTHVATPHLNGAYTSFGWLVEGWDVLDAIMQGDRLVHARIEPGS